MAAAPVAAASTAAALMPAASVPASPVAEFIDPVRDLKVLSSETDPVEIRLIR